MEAGVSIVHRIWLGSAVGEERLQRIRAADKALTRVWKHPADPNARILLRSILWTDAQSILREANSAGDVEFRDYEELVSGPNREFRPRVESFIQHGEYAFAADILRYLALERLGGLHLSVHWMASLFKWLTYRRLPAFRPTAESFKILCETLSHGQITPIDFPFTITGDGTVVMERSSMKLKQQIDSEILYVGTPHSPVMASVRQNLLAVLSAFQCVSDSNPLRVNRRWKMAIQSSRQPVIRPPARKNPLLDVETNLGLVTNLMPIMLACKHHGLFVQAASAYFRFWLEVPQEHRFVVHQWNLSDIEAGLSCPELTLERGRSQSWLRVPADYRSHSED